MKKQFLVYLFASLFMGLAVTSCSDDDDAPVNVLAGKTFDLQPVFVQEAEDAFSDPVIVGRPDIIEWESTNLIYTAGEGQSGSSVVDVMNLLLAFMPIDGLNQGETYMHALQRTLRHISFLPDGNIQAEYVENLTTEKDNWQKSPLGVATYRIESNSTMRLFINLDKIMMSRAGAEEALAPLMATLLKVLEGGIPLNYVVDGAKMSVYMDQNFLLPILRDLKPLFGNKAILDLVKEEANKAMPGLGFVINPIIGAIFRDMPAVIDGTTSIKLGLNLVEANSLV